MAHLKKNSLTVKRRGWDHQKLGNGLLTSQRRQLEVVHLREGDDQRELVLVHGDLEQGPASNDLQYDKCFLLLSRPSQDVFLLLLLLPLIP